MSVTRYTPVTHDETDLFAAHTEMEIDDWGQWVNHSDHEIIVEDLKEKIRKLESLLGI